LPSESVLGNILFMFRLSALLFSSLVLGLISYLFSTKVLNTSAQSIAKLFALGPGESGTVTCVTGRIGAQWLDGRARRQLKVTCTGTPTPRATATPVSTSSPTATPLPAPAGGTSASNSDTFPEISALVIGDPAKTATLSYGPYRGQSVKGCTATEHDRFFVSGPDGLKYRTWHPIVVPIDSTNPGGAKCAFNHEHGDAPPGATGGPSVSLSPTAPLPPFGYAAKVAGMFDELKAHSGFKVFTHYAGNLNGFGKSELDYGPGINDTYFVAVHQGTSGRGRLFLRMHSFEFWSADTHIYALADTGNVISKGTGRGGSEPARVIVDHQDAAYELWPFQVNVGGVWNSGAATFAVTNPMNHIHGDASLCVSDGSASAGCPDSVQLVSTSGEFCFLSTNPCNAPFGDLSAFWTGDVRTIHEPDWSWRNSGRETSFCTDTMGMRTDCGPDSIRQTVAAVDRDGSGARLMDRTTNSGGWDDYMNLPFGAPGGN